MLKTTPRELNMTPQNLVNARHRTEYTDGVDGRCDQLERGREGNESCTTEGELHEDLQL